MTDPSHRTPRFTLKQLGYFIAAADSLSIKLAAERVAISQPSISSAIAQLETEFGLQLFVRHHAQGLSLTPAGLTFLREAKALVRQAEDLYLVAGELSDQVAGPLDVGCLLTLAPLVMPGLCHSFTQAHPATTIRLVEVDQSVLHEKLRRAELSLAVTYDLGTPEDIEFEALADLPPVAVLAADHRLADRPRLALAELAPLPLILLDLPLSRDYFLSFFHQERLTPTIFARSEQQDVVRSLVAEGYGYALANVRPKNRAAMTGKKLVYIPLDGDFRAMPIGIASLRSLRLTRTAAAFVAHCRAEIASGEIPGMAPLPG